MRMISLIAGVTLLASAGLALADEATPKEHKQEQRIERRIRATLHGDPDLKNDKISVSFDGGTVTLKGSVDTAADRDRAESMARVDGVTYVDDQLTVGSQGVGAAISDTAVTADLKTKLLRDAVLRDADVSVTTNNGVVTLDGTVPSETARMKAVDLANSTAGVSRVEDRLRITGL